MLMLYFFISLFTFTYYIGLLSFMWFLKTSVFMLIKFRYGKRLKPLNSCDVMFVIGKQYQNLIHAVMVLNTKNKNDDVERVIKNGIQEKLFDCPDKYGKLMCSLHQFLGYYFLLKEDIVSDDVVSVLDVNKTKLESISDIFNAHSLRPLPLNGTLVWEVIVIKASDEWKKKNSLESHQVPLIIRMNHLIADGLSGLNLWATVFGNDQVNMHETMERIIGTPEKINPIFKVLKNAFLFFIIPGFFVVEYIRSSRRKIDGPKVVNEHHVVAKIEKPGENIIETIKKIKKNIGDITFSEIILAAISASLSSYFEKHCSEVPKSLCLALIRVIDMKSPNLNGTPQLMNQFGWTKVDVPIDIGSNSLLYRIEKIKQKRNQLMKNSHDLVISNFMRDYLLAYFPTPILKKCLLLDDTWSYFSNLPPLPKLSLNGYEVEDVYFFGPLKDQLCVGFSLISYDNRIHFGFKADTTAMSTQEECDEIVKNIFTSIDLLKLEVEKNI